MLFHFLRKIIYLSFALNILLFTFGCSQNKNVGIVGHAYTLQANIHDDDNSLDYSWFIVSQPDESNLSKKYLFYNNNYCLPDKCCTITSRANNHLGTSCSLQVFTYRE